MLKFEFVGPRTTKLLLFATNKPTNDTRRTYCKHCRNIANEHANKTRYAQAFVHLSFLRKANTRTGEHFREQTSQVYALPDFRNHRRSHAGSKAYPHLGGSGVRKMKMTCKAIDPKDNGDGATHWSVDDDDPCVCRTFGPFESQAEAEAYAKRRNENEPYTDDELRY